MVHGLGFADGWLLQTSTRSIDGSKGRRPPMNAGRCYTTESRVGVPVALASTFIRIPKAKEALSLGGLSWYPSKYWSKCLLARAPNTGVLVCHCPAGLRANIVFGLPYRKSLISGIPVKPISSLQTDDHLSPPDSNRPSTWKSYGLSIPTRVPGGTRYWAY